MGERLCWGILSTGSIARALAEGVRGSRRGRLFAVGSRTTEKAEAFGEEFDIPERYGTYQSVLDNPEVSAVYVATPHPMHAEWSIRAAEAGKHVLCEKPAGLHHGEVLRMVEAARANGVAFMEAFMYRCHPQISRVVQLVREGAIGEVKAVDAKFGFRGANDPSGRLLNPHLGGGGILDVGCYPVSMSRLIAGAALGLPFAEPSEVKAAGHLGETGVDEYAVATLRFPGDIVAQVSTGIRLALDNDVHIYGTEGTIHLPTPWVPNGRTGAGITTFFLTRKRETETISVHTEETLYGLEADHFAEVIAAGKQEAPSPAMSWDDTLGNMATLDRWREQIGLTYPQE